MSTGSIGKDVLNPQHWQELQEDLESKQEELEVSLCIISLV